MLVSGLTAQQRAVVEAGGGAWLVLAGAGTGKTWTLAHRAARLVALGVEPGRVCLATFSQRAASNMRAQLGSLGVAAQGVRAGTFHALALEALRRDGERVGWGGAFSLLPEDEAERALRAAAAQVGLAGVGAQAARLYAQCAQRGWGVAQGVEALWPEARGLEDALWGAFDAYARWKVQARALDFDDLLLGWSRLLALEDDREACEHVLVDEYQDVNPLQARLVEQLARVHGNAMVVGDDAQAIYGFRGASPGELWAYRARFEGCRVLRLEDSFRASPPLVALANASLPSGCAPKRLRAAQDGAPAAQDGALAPAAQWWLCRDEAHEARFVAEQVLALGAQGVPWSEVAVLARAHARLREVERALVELGVPCLRRSGAGLLERGPLRGALAWVRWLHNPRDVAEGEEAAQSLPHVGPTWAARLAQEAARAGVVAALRGVRLPSSARPGALEAAARLEAAAARPAELLREALALGAQRAQERSPLALEGAAALLAWAEQAEGLGEFLGRVGLLAGSEVELLEGAEAVSLSTIHRAKGLEWRAVFVVGLAEGFLPSWQSLQGAGALAGEGSEALEEEARVFHVAVTRARRQLWMTTPSLGRDAEGRAAGLRPSRFVEGLWGAGLVERGVVRGA